MLAVAHLPPISSFADGMPIYFLTGKKHLYQTLFCISSLARVANQKLHFILIDDGSFNAQLIAQINKQIPGAGIIQKNELDETFSKRLPAEKYPALHRKRAIYPHLKKLTDVHLLPGNKWKLVLDSDMLFWQEPTAILNWLMKPAEPLYMVDQVESYGYAKQLMKDLCGHDIPSLLNVGAIGLNSLAIDWGALEKWINVLEETSGSSYYLEQALSAMLVAGQKATVLNADEYVVNPLQLNDGAILHHYVDLSKKIYFEEAWKKLR